MKDATKQEAARYLADLIIRGGNGATLHPADGQPVGGREGMKEGFIVGGLVPEFSIPVSPTVTKDVGEDALYAKILAYLRRDDVDNALETPFSYIGGWVEGLFLVMDIVERHREFDDAFEAAKQRKQRAVYCVKQDACFWMDDGFERAGDYR